MTNPGPTTRGKSPSRAAGTRRPRVPRRRNKHQLGQPLIDPKQPGTMSIDRQPDQTAFHSGDARKWQIFGRLFSDRKARVSSDREAHRWSFWMPATSHHQEASTL
jgi:hypothetical protein